VHEILYRLLVLLWFVAYMAAIYLMLHMVVARFSRNPNGTVLWFFTVLTSPLTWPVRAVLPWQIPERRVRLVALGMYVALWAGTRWALSGMGGPRLG
jgi:hypothetical protein